MTQKSRLCVIGTPIWILLSVSMSFYMGNWKWCWFWSDFGACNSVMHLSFCSQGVEALIIANGMVILARHEEDGPQRKATWRVPWIHVGESDQRPQVGSREALAGGWCKSSLWCERKPLWSRVDYLTRRMNHTERSFDTDNWRETLAPNLSPSGPA